MRLLPSIVILLLLSGCAALSLPDNQKVNLFDPEKTAAISVWRHAEEPLTFSTNVCPPAGTTAFMMPPSRVGRRPGGSQMLSMQYSPGDRFSVAIYGSPELSGDYVINPDGMVMLAFAGQIEAAGLNNAQLASRIERAYVRAGLFTRDGLRLSVRPVLYAPIHVTVAGAVFHSGRHIIGGRKDIEKSDRELNKSGDNPLERYLPAALRAAGGVRPDADISAIRVIRGGKTYTLDWRGAMYGGPVDDMPLIEGDHVQVEEAECFQSALVRPSQITPPGIRIVYSNLTVPALTNAQSLQSHQFAGSVPYGTRFLQGLIQANCVGGTMTTNARRYAVLISRNPKTRETEVIQRSVEHLVRSADRDVTNPFLMPDDAMACYDSTVTEYRDMLGLIQATILPANTLRGALPVR